MSFNSFTHLFQKYPQIKKIRGIITDGIILSDCESSPIPTIPLEILGRYKLRNGNKGERRHYLSFQTDSGIGVQREVFCALTPGGEADCKEFTIAKGK